MDFLSQGFRKLSYYRQKDVYTYATEIIYHSASRMDINLIRQYSENKFQIRTVLNLERVSQKP